MEKLVVFLAFTFALALPVMGQQQDNQFSGFSLDDFQDLIGNSDQAKQAAASLGADAGVNLDDAKKAAADFQNQAEAQGMSLEDVKQAAETSFQGASDAGGSSWMDWAKDKLKGFGLVDGEGPSAAPGQAPESAPETGSATTTTTATGGGSPIAASPTDGAAAEEADYKL